MFTQSIQKTVTSEPDLRFARRKKKEKRKKGKKTYKIGGMVTNGWMRWSRDPHSADWAPLEPCGMVWYGVVWCGMVWYGGDHPWCGVVWFFF